MKAGNDGPIISGQTQCERPGAARRVRAARRLLPVSLALLLLAASGSRSASAATFTVTNSNGSGSGSLAAAITSANATVTADIIEFNILSLQAVSIGGTLPPITQPLTIDGYSAFLASDNSSTDATTNANLRIEIDGSGRSAGATIIDIQASNTTIRGLAIKNIPTNGNGIRVGAGKGNVSILGCFIGTNAGGLTDLSDGIGVRVEGSAFIGTVEAGDRNLFIGNDAAIQLHSSSSSVDNNLIGPDADGGLDVGNRIGVEFVAGASNNNIGESARNIIAGNDHDGVQAWTGAGSGNRFSQNRFYGNGELGIDIGNPGVDHNDEGDLDTGPNGIQNYPELTMVRYNGDTRRIRGTIRSKPGQYRIRFYRSSSPDPYGFGEGEFGAGGTVATITAGNTSVNFAVNFLGIESSGIEYWTAVAEEIATGNTSEFSRWIEAVEGGSEYVVTNTADSGPGSLRTGLNLAAEGPEPNTIVFAIPGDGPHTIAAPTPLSINGGGTIIIDGYSQSLSKSNSLGEGSNAVLRIVLTNGASDSAAAVLKAQNSKLILQGVAVHSGSGDGIQLINANGSQIRGNFIGTDVTGTVDLGNAGSGVRIENSQDVTIGGDVPPHRNVISGNQGDGIHDIGTRTRILGNVIGLGSTLQPLGNASHGIAEAGTNCSIGDDDPGLGNRIGYNSGAGVECSSSSSAGIFGNSIHGNGGLGIDLLVSGETGVGVTPNDVDDLDSGLGLQNFPLITSITVSPTSFSLHGTLDVNPATDTSYRIRVFASSECDPSGHGEGERFLGGRSIGIDPQQETFQTTEMDVLEPGEFVTVTATNSANRTSEFSACFRIPGGDAMCGDASGNETLSASDALLVLKAAVGSEVCALCVCDVNSSATITSSDALLVLRIAVGQSVTLNCPNC